MDNLRSFYENRLGVDRISDRTWGRITGIFKKYSLPLTKENLLFLVNIKKTFKVSSNTFAIACLVGYSNFISEINKKRPQKGVSLFKSLEKKTQADYRTIKQWFVNLTFNEFDPQRYYSPHDVFYLNLYAECYLLKYKGKKKNGKPKPKSTASH